MRVVSVQVGKPRLLGADAAAPEGGPAPRPWLSGYGKAAVAGPIFCGRLNLEGDGQADKKWHGGPEMAVLAYSADHYPLWRAELEWPAISPGAFGENLTVAGADEERVCIGDVWELGTVRLQVSEPRKPCVNISRFHGRRELLKQVIRSGRIGWYLRVLQEGTLQAGDEVRLLARPQPDWSVARAMRVRLQRKSEPAQVQALAALPELGADWRALLQLQDEPAD
jgi:MOSC domain-containing protein YiiM